MTRLNRLKQIVASIDLTSLNATDTEESILALCQKATTPLGSVAAFCCHPQFLTFARPHLAETILLATVVNFPLGNALLPAVLAEIDLALTQGANEIDLVIPYQQILKNHDLHPSIEMVKAVKQRFGTHTLKVIIESSELHNPDLIYDVSVALLAAGADFIKTSTGKTPVGATPTAVAAILKALDQHQLATGELKGLKVSGGVRTIADAERYMDMATKMFGEKYCAPHTFRIGASALLDQVLSLRI